MPSSSTVDEDFVRITRGAFMYAMRSVGIPARLVGGYLGGELNPNGGYLVVRQFDAHGWAEIWIAGESWVRIDPTSAVAPNRIENGLASALEESERSNLSLLTNARFNTGSLLSRALMTFDSIEHRWNMFVVGYDGQAQQHLRADWFGDLKPGRTALIMVALGGVCFGLVAFVLFFQREPQCQPHSPICALCWSLWIRAWVDGVAPGVCSSGRRR